MYHGEDDILRSCLIILKGSRVHLLNHQGHIFILKMLMPPFSQGFRAACNNTKEKSTYNQSKGCHWKSQESRELVLKTEEYNWLITITVTPPYPITCILCRCLFFSPCTVPVLPSAWDEATVSSSATHMPAHSCAECTGTVFVDNENRHR